MAYLNTETNEYPVSEREVRKRFPNIALPARLINPPAPWVNVFPTPKPTVTRLQNAVQVGTEIDGLGNRVQAWIVQDKFAEHVNEKGIPVTKLEQEAAYLADEFYAAKAAKKLALEAKSLKVESQGIIVDTLEISTDQASREKLVSVLSFMGRNPTETLTFRTKNGWGTADKRMFETIQDALWVHVKVTYANHKLHDDAINLLTTVEQIEEYDFSTGWP